MTKNNTITLPRSVVDQVLRALDYGGLLNRKQALSALLVALEHPQGEHEAEDAACRCEPSDWYPPADDDGDGSVDALARRSANKEPQGGHESTPNGATHRQPKQGAFYKRVDGKWYVWSRMENGESHRWYISPGTTESCLEPIYTSLQPPRQPLTLEQIAVAFGWKNGLPPLPREVHAARVVERAHEIGGKA